MKRKAYSLFVLAAVLSLMGCNNTNNEISSVNLSDDGDLVRDENGNIVYENVKLKLWSVTTGDDAAVQDTIINRFNQLYNGMINVEVTHHSRYDIESLLANTMNFDKDNAPNLIFNHGSKAVEYANNKWIYDVTPFFEKSEIQFDKEDFASSLLDAVTLDGATYGMPIDCHSVMMEMRLDILEKNNLKVPTNYYELVEVCDEAAELAQNNNLWIRGENSQGYDAITWRKASNAEEYTAFPISFGDMWVHEFFGYTAAIQNGGSLVNPENQYPGWYSQESVNGLQVLKDWIFPTETSVNKNPLSKDYGSSYDVGDEPFRNGSAIFKLQGPWSYQNDLNDFDRTLAKDGGSDNITTRNIGKMLALDDSKPYASKIKGEGHALMMVSTTTSLTKLCAETVFMDYIAYSSGIEWAKRGHIPAVNSVAQSEDYRNDPEYDKYIKYWGAPEDYVVVPPTKFYTHIDNYFKGALQKILAASFKDQSIDSILKQEYEDCIAYINLYS